MTNIVPFPVERRRASPALAHAAKGEPHSAEIRFFTGVRYSREATPEPQSSGGGRRKRRRARN
jgi:hypothetical protein